MPHTDRPALSGAPPSARLIWIDTDQRNLFIELPDTDGRPYITRHPITQAGLMMALGILRKHATDHVPADYTPSFRPTVGTPSQRDNAAAILRRMRIIG